MVKRFCKILALLKVKAWSMRHVIPQIDEINDLDSQPCTCILDSYCIAHVVQELMSIVKGYLV